MIKHNLFLTVYVITVGTVLPVVSDIFTIPSARLAKLVSATGADWLCLAGSFSYFSRYIRIVAPADPVPLRRNITRATSPLEIYSKFSIRPWLDVLDPSTGSM